MKIEPGRYDLGTTSLVMKPWVFVEGSGEGWTLITAEVASTTSGAITAAEVSSLSSLYIENTSPTSSYAIWDANTTLFTIDHVAAYAYSPTKAVALELRGSKTSITASNFLASGVGVGYGIESEVGSSPSIESSFAFANPPASGVGLLQDGATAVVRWSHLTGSALGAAVVGNGTLQIGGSEVKSVAVASGSTAQCAASFKETFAPLTPTCG